MEATAHCSLISTTRLKSIRQHLNRTSMSITDSGHVIMELKSHMTGQSESPVEITKELVRISSDGMKIEVFRNTEGVPCIDECHGICQFDQVYTYPNLPDKLWKKYQHAHKFVEVIKSRTAKVTLITDRARCKLMENSPSADFQVYFPDGVMLMLSKLKVTITDQNGSSLTFHEDMASSHVSPNTVTLVEYSQQCRDLCLKIEQSVCNLLSEDSEQDFFPITVGTSIQPCLMSEIPMLSPSRPGKAIDVWATRPDQTNILLHLRDVYNDAKTINQPVYSEQPHDSRQAENKFQSSVSEQKSQHNCVYEHDSKLCLINNLLEPYQTADYKSMPNEPDFHTNLPSETDIYQLLPEKYNQFEDFDPVRSRSLNRKCHSALTTPQKSNIASFSLRPFYSKSMEHLVPECVDVIEKNMPIQSVYCESHDQSAEQQEMTRLMQENNLAYKFRSECNIPQYVDAFGSTCPRSNNKFIPSEEQKQLVLSPLCHSNPCDNILYQHNQAMCSTNIPDFTTSEFQNNFSTPRKSSVPLERNLISCNGYSIQCKHLNKSGRYNHRCTTETDHRYLQNVRRNLFADQTLDEETFSSLSSSQPSILQSELLELLDESSSENSTNQNLSQDSIFYDNHNFVLMNQSLNHENQSLVPENKNLALKNQSLFPENQMARIQTQMLPSCTDKAFFQPSLPVKNSLPEIATQHTPVKVPSIVKSVLRYSECSGTSTHQNSTLAQASTEISNPSEQRFDYEYSLDNSEVNKLSSKKDIPDFDLRATQEQMQKLVPEVNTSPTKPAPIRKVATLSPLKMSSRILSENRFKKNLVSNHTQSSDFFLWGHQTIPVHSLSISSSSLSPANSTASYHTTQSKECLINPKSDPSLVKQSARGSTHAVHSCKEFPPLSQTASNWSDVHLPFLPHVQNSLEVSSDGYSSPPSSASDVICQVFVPYTGWASFYATGTVWILYNDGTQLGVKSTEAIMIYVDQDGSRTRYSNADVVPEIVKLKLEKLPKVIDMLMKSHATDFAGTLL